MAVCVEGTESLSAQENRRKMPGLAEEGEALRWEYAYLIVLCVYTAAVLLPGTVLCQSSPVSDSLLKAVRYSCYAAAVVKICHDVRTPKGLAAAAILMAAGGLTAFCSGDRSILFIFIMMTAAAGTDAQRMLKCIFTVRTLILLITVLLTEAGVTEDYLFDATDRVRHSLGFTWTMLAPTVFLFVVMCYVNIRRERMTLVEVLLIGAVNIWLYEMTNTRSVMLVCMVYIVWTFLMGLRLRAKKRSTAGKEMPAQRPRRNWRMVLTAVPTLCCITAIALHACYSPLNPVMEFLNRKLSGRLKLGYTAMGRYGITWFGQPITWIGWSRRRVESLYNYVDSSYLQILLNMGIVMLCVIVFLYSYMIFRAVRENNLYMVLTLIMICVLCMVEPRLAQPEFNPFLLLAFADDSRNSEVSGREQYLPRTWCGMNSQKS